MCFERRAILYYLMFPEFQDQEKLTYIELNPKITVAMAWLRYLMDEWIQGAGVRNGHILGRVLLILTRDNHVDTVVPQH